VRFLLDRCAGRRLAEALRAQGHDVLDARGLEPDPGDATLLAHAARGRRILLTIDTDFGHLLYAKGHAHAGLVRLPDVPAERRIALMSDVLARHGAELESGAVVTVRGGRIRISKPGP
jgi:predicted nuclease of predicted toxin-antitoxin system